MVYMMIELLNQSGSARHNIGKTTDMTHTTHTPGPWTISGSSIWNTETHRAIYASGCKPINERDEEGQANARLIAAAPDMKAALQAAAFALETAIMLQGLVALVPTLDAVKAAIAKTE